VDELLHLEAVRKVYPMGGQAVHALRGVDLRVMPGEYVAIMGHSGSGKSTLLNMLGCLDRPSEGHYWLDGLDVADMNDDALSEARNQKIGFVFQSFNLIPRLTVLANIEPSRGRWPTTRSSCWRTSPPATSTAGPATKSSTSSTPCTTAGGRSSW
jgi:putative ABC transport system ATP-binding protein